LCHPKHRNSTPNASQWDVTEAQERQIFAASFNETWIKTKRGHGLYTPAGKPLTLGKARSKTAFIAIFRSDGHTWHGYPELSEYANIPSDTILEWLNMGYIKMRTMRRLSKGQPCDL
jgi:hypothetical protein